MRRDWQNRPMDAVDVARSLALGRAVAGTGLLLAPGRIGTAWLGAEARTGAARTALRAMGARDLGIALGALSASERGESLVPWVLAGAAADGVDAVATVAAFSQLHPRGRWLLLGVAGAAAAAGIWAAGLLAP